MIENREPIESRVDGRRDAEEAVHQNFRPREGQADGEGEQTELEQTEAKKEMQHQATFGTELQGEIGEGVSLRVASERLGLMPDPRFDQTRHGLDGVFREGKGRLVVVESKLDNRGIRALRGDQMQPEWVERNAKMMQDPANERFTPGNAEIGADLEAQGCENVRRLVIATDPASLQVRIYEGQPDLSWKQIDTFSAWDLEQPYLME